MRRFLILTSLALLLLGVVSGTAEGAAKQKCHLLTDLSGYICEDEEEATEVGTEPSGAVMTVEKAGIESKASDRPVFAPYERIVPNGGTNGEPCVTTGYREVPDNVDPGVVSALPDRLLGNIRATYPECPVETGAQPSIETPQSYARSYWKLQTLPVPRPHIAPGRAITGMLAYLETRGTATHTYTEPNTPFGPLTVVATGKYYVDWGDGTETGPHSQEGGPWPDGSITHEYIHIGAYDVVVTERWTATWAFGPESGVLDELRTVGRIDDFPVQQIQAVVLR